MAARRGIEEDGPSEGERKAAADAAFRRRLARGEYAALLGTDLGDAIASAAERALSEELGALRVVLARLLTEEQDLAKLAAGVARLAGVAAQVARARKAVGGDADDAFNAAWDEFLGEADG